MKEKGYIKLLSICLFLIIMMGTNSVFKIFNNYTYPLFLFLLFVATVFIIGFEKEKSIYKKYILTIVIITTIIYTLLIYGAGVFVAFAKNGNSLRLIDIFKNIILTGSAIVFGELIRYNLLIKGERNRSIIILTTIALIITEISVIIHGFAFEFATEIVRFIFSYVLIIIFQNIFLSYTSLKIGYKSTIVYRLIIALPAYFMPLLPSLGMYMEAVLQIVLPLIIFIVIYKTIRDSKGKEKESIGVNKGIFIVSVPVILLMIIINSGWFKYYTLTIGTGSMKPLIDVGDIVIVEKRSESELKNIVIGDVLVFKHGDKVIVHRVIDINVNNNEYKFRTKGDANEDEDLFVTSGKDVLGVSQIKIPFLGYPSIWIKDFIE